ncbi:MAG: tetratricopeptide repeat protein [Bryobacterales bacterium]|nr:tetratricopeptide repeat protein [Bryobacterales bacterium]
MPLSPGTRLGPYEILAQVGAGGMGEVYRARDPRLNRDVAIKVSAARFPERFEREAKAIAALNHPNICQIYDVGPDYLVMEFIEGAPPVGPLPSDQAIRYALQICAALDAAHKKNITHRDLKPSNILVTASGVKLLDFGLAKIGPKTDETAFAATVPDNATRIMDPTEEGTVMGTAAYMSPEQARGEDADARSDIFSFGAVLYELVSGRRAFPGNAAIESMAAILRDEPEPLDASSDISAVITRCLCKSPASRFQTMGEVRAALEDARLVPAEDTSSIAVLPFTNIGADKENEYFGDGLAEEILNALSQVDGLRVAARTSSFFFKGKGAELSEVAAKLRVANILEGSVRRSGNRIRVMVQLVDARNGFHLWSERYDRQMEDIFDVQDDIARAIARRFKAAPAGGVKRSTNNLEAYELYLKGRHYWHQRSPATLLSAIQSFEETIRLDPNHALAWAGLADCYAILRAYGWVSTEESRPRAHAAVMRAMALAPALWEVNYSRGLFTLYFDRAWREAGPYFRKALDANPEASIAHVYQSVFLSLEGRAEEAVTHATLACRLDPLSPSIHGVASMVLYTLRRFDEAMLAAQQALELQPEYLIGLWVVGLALCGLGRGTEAIKPLERAVALSDAPGFVGNLGLGYARAGRLDDARRLLRELEERGGRGEYVPALALLAIHTALGDLPAMRRAHEKTLGEPTPAFALRVTIGPFLEEFRDDPEIRRMLGELYGG